MVDNLWAPWRIGYVKKEKSSDDTCVFCQAAKNRPETFVLSSAHCYVLMNKFPYNNGHLLVIPNSHINSLELLSEEEAAEIHQLSTLCIQAMRTALSAQGFNIGYNIGAVGGAGIQQHLHQHIVPRWPGDTNFMPVVGQTKVISQSTEDACRAIREGLKQLQLPAGYQL